MKPVPRSVNLALAGLFKHPLRPLRSTIITRFDATTSLSATQGDPACPSRASGWGLSPRRLGLPVLTLPSFAHMPAPIPRCSCLVLLLLASQADSGLRLIRTGSAVTLPVSRLARRSVFILACVLVDPATAGSFTPEASCSAVTSSSRSGYFRLEQQLPGGFLPPTGRARSFHGALGIWVKNPSCRISLATNNRLHLVGCPYLRNC
jgi:hypothetical protein